MAFDGSVIANVVRDLQALVGARISKIAQPEPDEILLTLSGSSGQSRLLISAGASLPLIYLTDQVKPNPATAPAFCMLLRKHIGGGHITAVSQPSLERIIHIDIEHLDEMGDRCCKRLIIELMGKYSNIIFTDDSGRILDSIKHVSSQVSSLREVLPGRDYFLPAELTKANPMEETEAGFTGRVLSCQYHAAKFLYMTYAGLSPIMSEELCHRSDVDADSPLTRDSACRLWEAFDRFRQDISAGRFSPCIICRRGEPIEFSSMELSIYEGFEVRRYDSISQVLEAYYSEKEAITRIRQKNGDLRRVTDTATERTARKLDLQLKQLKDTEKKDKYKLYGELIRAYAYSIPAGARSAVLQDYNDDYKEVTVPLDETLSAQDNATRYYDRYQKLRRTALALGDQIAVTETALAQLHEIKLALDIAVAEDDLAQIKQELTEAGYIKKQFTREKGKPKKPAGKPLHYMSSEGLDIYVGKNNIQNEELTFGAAGSDWWFHAKGRPGSHVIVKCGGAEPTDRTFEEAAALAAYYSSAPHGEKVEVDYTRRRNIRKPASGYPGLVIYHTNYSMVATADISRVNNVLYDPIYEKRED